MMKRLIFTGLSTLAIINASLLTVETIALAKNSSGGVGTVATAGTLDAGRDHFINVNVESEPFERLRIVCVTFHKFSAIKVVDAATNQPIPHTIDLGFEEINITFDQSLQVGKTVKIIIENSTVRGIGEGITVPYRIFAFSNTFGEIPLGTALVKTPDND
ncbi:MAG: hypothetical protein AAGF26_20485 [Cyanobacteria bacterium P01_G01_bin.49]